MKRTILAAAVLIVGASLAFAEEPKSKKAEDAPPPPRVQDHFSTGDSEALWSRCPGFTS